MCNNITFLDAAIEISDASRDLKIKHSWAVLARYVMHLAYDIRNEHSARIRREKAKAKVFARLLWQLNVNGVYFGRISSVNCHFHL